MNRKSVYSGIVIVLISVFCGFYVGKHYARSSRQQYVAFEPEATKTASRPPLINPFLSCISNKGLRMDELKSFKEEILTYMERPEIKDKGIFVSYYFRDMNNGMSIGINEKTEYSPASLMKVQTMIAVLKEAQVIPGMLGKQLQYKRKDIMVGEESGFAKQDGAFYSIEELLNQSIQYSDNAATHMLTNFIGDTKITKVEDDLNMHIDPGVGPFTNFVSIRQYVGAFRVLYNGGYLNDEMSEKALEMLSGAKYLKGMRAAIPASIPIAQKYGRRDFEDVNRKETMVQLHQFGLVYYPGKPFILAIMMRGGNGVDKEKILYDLSKITYDAIDGQMKMKREDNSANEEIRGEKELLTESRLNQITSEIRK